MNEFITQRIAEGDRLSKLLDDALAFGKRQVREYADTEQAYRVSQAESYLNAPEGLTAAAKAAWVAGATSGARHRRDIAEGMKQLALEAIRSRRAQLSALQTYMNAEREEAKHERFGPEVAA